MEVTLFTLNFTINPVAFEINIGNFSWQIYWYGILIATGFLLALIYGFYNAKRFGVDSDRLLDVVLVTVPVAILCARIYYVLFDGEKLSSIGEFFGIGSSSGISGLAIFGGVIGAAAAGTIMCKIKKIKPLDALDLAALGFLIGQGIGRWGNFMNQEAFGTLTGSSWWGMESYRTQAVVGEGLVHPCFLYESIWCILGFFLLHKISRNRKFSGQIALLYCVWYGFERGFLELIRTDSLMLGNSNIRVSSLLSFVICISAAAVLVVITKKRNEKALETNYESIFKEEDIVEEASENVNDN